MLSSFADSGFSLKMAAVIPNCDDRVNNPDPPPAAPGMPQIITPCQDNTIGAAIMPGLRFGAQTPCPMQGANPVYHAAGHTVCGRCTMIAHQQAFRTQAHVDLVSWSPPVPPPGGAILPLPPPPGPGRPRWRGLLTRLCHTCERREQELCRARQGAVAPPPPIGLPLNITLRLQNYPLDTCTCRADLDNTQPGERLCNWHRRRLWGRVWHFGYRNEAWLHTLDVKPGKGQWLSCTARASTRNKRASNGTYRACRCGSDVDPSKPVEVLMCMACEGTVHVVVPGGSRYQPLGEPKMNRGEARPIALFRPRSRKTPANAMSVED